MYEEEEYDEYCAVCPSEGKYKCGKCCAIFYCSKRHQNLSWPKHKKSCYPYTLRENKRGWTSIYSSREIKAGEVIFKENALFFAPQRTDIPLCVGCYVPVDLSYECPQCFWPMCSASCPGHQDHRPECFLTISEFGLDDIAKRTKFIYQVIGPMRLLGFKITNPGKFNRIIETALTRLYSSRKKHLRYKHLALYMKDKMRIDCVDDADIVHAFEIAKLNLIEIPSTNKMGFYETICNLGSACSDNVFVSFNTKEQAVVRASVDIPKNHRLALSYFEPFLGADERRKMKTQMGAFCDCYRCSDPTDRGTYLSSLRCTECKKGLLLPPPSQESQWTCQNCGKTKSPDDVEKVLKECVKKAAAGGILVGEMALYHTERFLSENHFIRISIKTYLCLLYGTADMKQYGMITESTMLKKLKACRDVVQTANHLKLGYSDMRGSVMSELCTTLLQLYVGILDEEGKYAKDQKSIVKRHNILKEMEELIPHIENTYLEDSIKRNDRFLLDELQFAKDIVRRDLSDLAKRIIK